MRNQDEMKKKTTKLVREGEFVAEVDVDLLVTDEAWSPYLSVDDAYKLDEICAALREGYIEMAANRLAL